MDNSYTSFTQTTHQMVKCREGEVFNNVEVLHRIEVDIDGNPLEGSAS